MIAAIFTVLRPLTSWKLPRSTDAGFLEQKYPAAEIVRQGLAAQADHND